MGTFDRKTSPDIWIDFQLNCAAVEAFKKISTLIDSIIYHAKTSRYLRPQQESQSFAESPKVVLEMLFCIKQKQKP